MVELDERAMAFEFSGRLVRIDIRRGQRVSAGEVIARLDDQVERQNLAIRNAELTVAESQLALLAAGARPEDLSALRARLRGLRENRRIAEQSLARTERLLGVGASTPVQRDQLSTTLASLSAEEAVVSSALTSARRGARLEEVAGARARVEAARAGVRAAQERLDRYALRSPIAANVLDLNFEEGEVVGAGVPVVVLGDPDRPFVDVFVPQRRISEIHMGAAATVRIDARRRALAGQIEDIGRRTEFTPRYLFSEEERANLVLRVRVRIDDPEHKLFAGVPTFVTFDRTEGASR